MRHNTSCLALALLLRFCCAAAANDPPVDQEDTAAQQDDQLPRPSVTPQEAARQLQAYDEAQPQPTIAQLQRKLAVRNAEVRRLQKQILLLVEEVEQLRNQVEGLRIAVEALAAARPQSDAEIPITEPRPRLAPDVDKEKVELPPEMCPNASL